MTSVYSRPGYSLYDSLKLLQKLRDVAFDIDGKLFYTSAGGAVYACYDVPPDTLASLHDMNVEYVPSEHCFTFTAGGRAYKLRYLTQTEIDLLMLFS